MNKTIAVFDLKAFYATCECALRGLDPYSAPLVVCDKERGTNTIILSVSPYLKSKGIPSRCRLKELPKGYDYIYAVPRMETYIEKSYEVISILLRFFSSEDMLVYSIDEVFVDLSTYLDYYKLSPRDLCRMVNKEINKETGLLVSTGIGDSMFLSKVALDNYAKHSEDYIGFLYKDEIKEKLWTISPLTNIWGIGERTQLRLNMMGLYTMEDIANSSEEYLQEVFGVHGKELYEYANGIDESDIHDVYIPKETSLSVGQVLFKDYTKEEIKLIIHEMNEDLSQRLHLQKQLTKCIHLYIGYSKEGGAAKQVALDRATDDTEELYEAFITLLDKICDPTKTIRRVSISYSKLKSVYDNEQLSLFESVEDIDKKRNLEYCISSIKDKYGDNAVLNASALLSYSTIRERHNQIGGHRK